MARILAKGLFDDESKVEFVQQDPAARIPNITTGKVDIVIQFMTITPQRSQLVAFTRPYYVEGIALLTRPDAVHVSYVHTPMRYVWDMWPQYFGNKGKLYRVMVAPLLNWTVTVLLSPIST